MQMGYRCAAMSSLLFVLVFVVPRPYQARRAKRADVERSPPADDTVPGLQPAVCRAWQLQHKRSTSSIGWLGRPATRATAKRWAVHNASICIPEVRAEASVRGQCALPQGGAVLGCLQLPAGECRAAVCVPGFTVPDGEADARRAPGCVTRSHADADVPHVMCASGCLLLTLSAAPLSVPAPRDVAAQCASSWRTLLTEAAPGSLWYDGLVSQASLVHDVAGGTARQLLVFATRPSDHGSESHHEQTWHGSVRGGRARRRGRGRGGRRRGGGRRLSRMAFDGGSRRGLPESGMAAQQP